MWKNRVSLLPSCCECLNETSRNAATCSSILNNRFAELKKKLDSKFSKPYQNMIVIETSLNAPNTSDVHSDNLNFVSSKRGWFFRNGKMDSFPEGKRSSHSHFGSNCWIFFPKREDLPLLEVTAEMGLWYGLCNGIVESEWSLGRLVGVQLFMEGVKLLKIFGLSTFYIWTTNK